MLRLRRYRVFVVLAVIAVGLLYHFRNLGGINNARTASVQGLKNFGGLKHDSSSTKPPPTSEPNAKPYAKLGDIKDPAKKAYDSVFSIVSEKLAVTSSTPTSTTFASTSNSEASVTPGRHGVHSSDEDENKTATDTGAESSIDAKTAKFAPVAGDSAGDYSNVETAGRGRLQIIADDTSPKIHWKKQKEHFPIPTESIIQLPTGAPKEIPRIQAKFPDESATEKIDREKKLDKIKKTFIFSWSGYKKNAWMHDELSPVSGQYRDPFCGWAATLVDSLDTLWMMGLKSEFDEAVKAVANIDFTTSIRNDIPVFETVIRYLGGLIAAYDLGGSKYRILLVKAVELAEILMGCFDTPNRMPMTFYLWKPTFASQPHRANTRVVLAEIGSLSVEFTRLAQITKEAKYYDAIARITNEFEMWQNNTRLPGLWPMKVDASGCKKEDTPLISPIENTMQKGPGVTTEQKVEKIPDTANSEDDGETARTAGLEKYIIKTGTGAGLKDEGQVNADSTAKASKTTLEKKQLVEDSLAAASAHPKPDCKPQGLSSPPFTTVEDFTLGGQADSVYEYLPKEYLLLGGLEPQYQKMYEPAVEAVKKYLLFRPMIQEEGRGILLSGQVSISGKADDKSGIKLKAELTHLTCFVGGMFAMGAKIFNREDDLALAEKLTDGCVWAYESTTTGIMPESSLVLPCESREHCAWNETRYWEALDPYRVTRSQRDDRHQTVLEDKHAAIDQKPKKSAGQAGASIVKAQQDRTSSVGEDSMFKESVTDANLKGTERKGSFVSADLVQEQPNKSNAGKSLAKRQLGDIENDNVESSSDENSQEARSSTPSSSIDSEEPVNDKEVSSTEADTKDSTIATAIGDSESESSPSAIEAAVVEATKPVVPLYTPPPIPTPEEFAKARIRDERLPSGITKVTSPKYILRPEAIESVFIMWRITGDVYWRKKGWDMFESIYAATAADYGASAITDVTSETPVALDEMESFWLAETLKYFYLLFSDPSFISLDEYVLNTEAHPFKRPK